MGKAVSLLSNDQFIKNVIKFEEMREYMIDKFINSFDAKDILINGPLEREKRLPNTLSISFRDVNAHKLLSDISERVAISAGSACHSGTTNVSTVLSAMNIDKCFI